MPSELHIYKKEVDWSVLHEGFTICVADQGLFYENMNLRLAHGERKSIKLLIEGREFHAELINQGFDQKKYPEHPDMLQIRYRRNGEFSKYMQTVFYATFTTIGSIKNSGKLRPKQRVKLPYNEREYIALYSTAFDDTFTVDCITSNEIKETGKIVNSLHEFEIEQILQNDTSAALLEKIQMVKIRKLDRTIGENLKRLYKNHCQICGLFVGERYDATVIHTHHIDYFSKSLNNDANNIMVVCPNHHGVIHAVNPTFNRKKLSFSYPNGLEERLSLNRHL
jgi:predicted HNH restriction endonuclease